jgi:hypothetical protein
MWRMSDHILPSWLHPARCGFLLAFNNPFVWPSVVTVHVDPARPDCWDNPWAKTVFGTLAEQWNCLVAVGQVPGTSHVFCPDGCCITMADYPKLMHSDKGTIGAPSFVFGPDRRPIVERMAETAFVWALPPQPNEPAP